MCLTAIARIKHPGETRDAVDAIYPTAEDGRITVAILHAAREVRDLNFKYLSEGKGAPVTARFGEDGITVIEPLEEGGVMRKIYEKAV